MNSRGRTSRDFACDAGRAGVTALDIVSSVRLTSEKSPAAGHDPGSFQVEEQNEGHAVLTAAVTVNRPREEVYAFWKDPRNYAEFMDHLDSVHPTTGGRSRWKVKSAPGISVEWDADIVVDTPNEMIRWRSTESSSVENTGTVRFRKAPAGRGTLSGSKSSTSRKPASSEEESGKSSRRFQKLKSPMTFAASSSSWRSGRSCSPTRQPAPARLTLRNLHDRMEWEAYVDESYHMGRA